MAGIFVEIAPSNEVWYGPTNVALKNFTKRFSDSTQHILYFGGEGSPLTPESVVRVDYAINGDPNQPSLFYGPGTKNGPFITQSGSNRSMSLNPNGDVSWYFVFVEQA